MTVYEYVFQDGTRLKLIEMGLSVLEIWKLEEIHGKLERTKNE